MKNFLKKNWVGIVNFIILIIAYNGVYNYAPNVWYEVILGLWIFTIIANFMFNVFKKGV